MHGFPALQRTFKSLPKSCIALSIPTNHFSNAYISSTTTRHLKSNSPVTNKTPSTTPDPDVYQYTKLITHHTRNNRLDEALHLFDKMPVRDIVSWNSMIRGCLDCGNLKMGLKLFDEMPERNVVSWTTVVSGCAQFGELDMAEKLFERMPWRDTAAWNSMLFGYFSNVRIDDACMLFKKMPNRNVISWTTMIGGLDQCGLSEKALLMYLDMSVSGVKPTSNTYSCVITACANISALQCGVQFHGHVVKLGYVFDTFVLTSLITFYANCMQIENSLKVFYDRGDADVVIWTALLTGYGFNGKHEEALKVFCAMMDSGTRPNQSTFTSALHCCCELGAFDKGKELHAQTIKVGLDIDLFVGNSLIVMYTKSGCVDDGIRLFNNLSKRNLVSWNSVIVGCAQNGYGAFSLEIFDQMKRVAVPPDEITYVGLLTACSHSRMLEKGKYIFELLNRDPSVDINLEHCTCMVDILGRDGKLEEAEEFIMNMPMKPNFTIWMALISACGVHSNLEIAKRAAHWVLDLEPHNSAVYVQISNLYASAGWWGEASKIRELMTERGFVKQTGSSWITLK